MTLNTVAREVHQIVEDPMLSPNERKKKIRLAPQTQTMRISDCLSSKHKKSESFDARGKRLPILPQGRLMTMWLAQCDF